MPQRPSWTANSRADEKIAALEWSLAAQRERLAGIETAIHYFEPELELPTTNRKPNPIFDQGAILHLALALRREAGRPVAQCRGWFSRDQESMLYMGWDFVALLIQINARPGIFILRHSSSNQSKPAVLADPTTAFVRQLETVFNEACRYSSYGSGAYHAHATAVRG